MSEISLAAEKLKTRKMRFYSFDIQKQLSRSVLLKVVLKYFPHISGKQS